MKRVLPLACVFGMAVGTSAFGQTIGTPAAPPQPAVPVAPYRPSYTPPPAPVAPPPVAPQAGGQNPAVEGRAQSLPLDPGTRNLRNQLPADVPGTERRLGLRPPRSRPTNFAGRTPSSREIVDALAPR